MLTVDARTVISSFLRSIIRIMRFLSMKTRRRDPGSGRQSHRSKTNGQDRMQDRVKHPIAMHRVRYCSICGEKLTGAGHLCSSCAEFIGKKYAEDL